MNKRFLSLLFFLLVHTFSQAEEGIRLQWEEIPDHTYRIEIEKEGIPLFIQRLSEPQITLDLSPGSYTYRVTFLNKFEKADALTEWIELTILKDLEPVIIDVPEHRIFAEDRPQKLIVHTADIMDGALIQLEKDNVANNLSYEPKGPNTLELTLETENLAPGLYSLRIINPSGSETVKENCVFLRRKTTPVVSELEPRTAFLNEQLPRVMVRGSGIDRDVVAFLEKDGRRHRLPISEYIDENKVALWCNLQGLKAGIYNLVLINPPLEETTITNAFAIIDPGKVRDEAFYDNIRWGTDLLIGFPLADVIFDQAVTNYTIIDKGGLTSPFPEIELVIRSDINSEQKILQYLGWFGRIAFFPPIDSGNFTSLTMGFYGRTRFKLPVNLFAEASMGYRWIDLENETESIHFDGTLFTYGGGLVINYDRFLLEFSARQDFWIIESTHLDVSQITLRLGYRF